MSFDARRESAWWDDPPGGIEANAYGVPPYDVEAVAKRIIDILEPSGGDLILDLGCGPGRTMRQVRKASGANVVGVDSSVEMVRLAEIANPTETVVLNDGRNLEIGRRVDHAYSITVLQHIPPDAAYGYISEVYCALNAGGRFVFTHSPGPQPEAFLHHQCRFEEPVRWAYAAGFRKFLQIPPDPIVDALGWAWYAFEKGAW